MAMKKAHNHHVEVTEEELKEVIKMFPDLPNPEMYPKSFDYCVKVYQTLISINNKWKNYEEKS
jgi:hypothetical protein|tara:strand:+ start:294 stop:482 length:189 start_codon:yes stop_codon:yes gene_type:complete